MADTYNLGAYQTLIYTKLDLPQVPTVDSTALLAWMMEPERKIMSEPANYKKVKPDAVYPWRPVWAYDGEQWDTEFAAQFPQIIDYVKLFPATDWRRVNFLAQLSNSEVFQHVDPDYGLGWRVYFTSGGPRLYFSKFKNWSTEDDNAFGMTDIQDITARCEDARIYVPAPEVPYAYALTSACAGHSVERNTGPTGLRIVMLIMPRIECVNVTEHQALLKRSTEKYASEAIWY